MQKFLIPVIIIILLLGAGGWYFYFRKQPEVASPITPINVLPQKQQIPPGEIKSNDTSKNAAVTNDFKIQIQGGEKLVLDKPVIASQYAIQTWSDENKGGQALLEYRSGQGWLLVTMGGGAWSVDDLMKLGVPQATAKQLLEVP